MHPTLQYWRHNCFNNLNTNGTVVFQLIENGSKKIYSNNIVKQAIIRILITENISQLFTIGNHTFLYCFRNDLMIKKYKKSEAVYHKVAQKHVGKLAINKPKSTARNETEHFRTIKLKLRVEELSKSGAT